MRLEIWKQGVIRIQRAGLNENQGGRKVKLKRCFIDHDGNIWKDSTLIEASKDIKAKPFDVDSISLDETIRWKVVNLRDYINHYKRVRDSDCSISIILSEDGYPMDGWHRIIKAKSQGGIRLWSRQFIKNPKPDFINK